MKLLQFPNATGLYNHILNVGFDTSRITDIEKISAAIDKLVKNGDIKVTSVEFENDELVLSLVGGDLEILNTEFSPDELLIENQADIYFYKLLGSAHKITCAPLANDRIKIQVYL